MRPSAAACSGEFFLAYKRSYPIHDDPYAFAGAFDDAAAGKPEPGFDVMTEILVKDRDTMEKMLAAARLPENAPRFAADEENFMDRSSMRLYVTEEFS